MSEKHLHAENFVTIHTRNGTTDPIEEAFDFAVEAIG